MRDSPYEEAAAVRPGREANLPGACQKDSTLSPERRDALDGWKQGTGPCVPGVGRLPCLRSLVQWEHLGEVGEKRGISARSGGRSGWASNTLSNSLALLWSFLEERLGVLASRSRGWPGLAFCGRGESVSVREYSPSARGCQKFWRQKLRNSKHL